MTAIDNQPQPRATLKVSDDARIVELLIAAAEYAAFAMDRLIKQYDDEDDQLRKVFYDYVSLTHGLEVNFLFPNVTQRERELLSAIMGARNALLVGLNGLRQWRSDDQKSDHEDVIRKLRERFVLLRSELVSCKVKERVSPIQQRLLEQEFLSVPGHHAGHTGFFTRDRDPG
jgi:hypothetical protein